MGATRHYLLLYNSSLCIGWAWVLERLLVALATGTSTYDAVALPLQIFQSLAVLEVLHAAVGLVRTSVMTTALQLSSRMFVLWCIVWLVPVVQTKMAFSLMVAAWSLTEVPRYFYFAVCAQGKPPRSLVWLRYTTFIPLYPLGATSEWLTIFHALPAIKEGRILSVTMPNSFNFAFDYWLACCGILVLYLPGLPFMYSHMIRQRRKYLGRARVDAAAKVV